jgi:hypothetical protein
MQEMILHSIYRQPPSNIRRISLREVDNPQTSGQRALLRVDNL